jgi:NAD(P)-dependent dehydrogenase (short-subunit alcohol dehydrogenase family)
MATKKRARKVAVVIGVSKGIRAAIAKHLADEEALINCHSTGRYLQCPLKVSSVFCVARDDSRTDPAIADHRKTQ